MTTRAGLFVTQTGGNDVPHRHKIMKRPHAEVRPPLNVPTFSFAQEKTAANGDALGVLPRLHVAGYVNVFDVAAECLVLSRPMLPWLEDAQEEFVRVGRLLQRNHRLDADGDASQRHKLKALQPQPAQYLANGVGRGNIMHVRYWIDTPEVHDIFRNAVLSTVYAKDARLPAPRFAAMFSTRGGYPQSTEHPPADTLRAWLRNSPLVLIRAGAPPTVATGRAFAWPTEWTTVVAVGEHRLAHAYPHGLLVQCAPGDDDAYVFPPDGPRNLPRSAAVLDALVAASGTNARSYRQTEIDAIHANPDPISREPWPRPWWVPWPRRNWRSASTSTACPRVPCTATRPSTSRWAWSVPTPPRPTARGLPRARGGALRPPPRYNTCWISCNLAPR